MSDLIEQDPFNRRVQLLLPVVHQRSGQSRMSLNGQLQPFTPCKIHAGTDRSQSAADVA